MIRAFRLEDYDAAVRIWEAAGLPYRAKGRDRRDRIASELEMGKALFFVAEEGGRMVGGRMVGVVFGTHDGRRGWINRLAVLPAWQHRGIACMLLERVEEELHALGIDVIAALIEDHNEASMRFFVRRGYLDDRRIHYFSKRGSPDS